MNASPRATDREMMRTVETRETESRLTLSRLRLRLEANLELSESSVQNTDSFTNEIVLLYATGGFVRLCLLGSQRADAAWVMLLVFWIMPTTILIVSPKMRLVGAIFVCSGCTAHRRNPERETSRSVRGAPAAELIQPPQRMIRTFHGTGAGNLRASTRI